MEFAFQMVGDLGAAASGSLVLIGGKLGLFRELAKGTALSPAELAQATGTDERYIREWLSTMAASSYIQYDADTGKFQMLPEQAMVLANSDSPVYLMGGFQSIQSLYFDENKIAGAFKSGEGVGWGDHSSCLYTGVAAFFRPGYQNHLIQDWIPAVEGLEAKVKAGATVADVGCGHALSTILMAQAYPKSTFVGFDPHEESIKEATAKAKAAGVTNARFEVSTAKEYEGSFDMIAFFDCLHDMGDPVGAARHAKSRLAEGGTLMLIEPMAEDTLEGNLNPVGRLYYSFSTMICTPSSRSQEVGLGLGAQAGEKRLGEVLREAGFSKVNRATETPFNMILEAR